MQDSASLLVWARVGVCDLGITGFHFNTLANSLLPPKARASEDSVRKWAFAFWNGECGVRMRLNVLRGSLLAIPFHGGNKFLLGLGTLTAALWSYFPSSERVPWSPSPPVLWTTVRFLLPRSRLVVLCSQLNITSMTWACTILEYCPRGATGAVWPAHPGWTQLLNGDLAVDSVH